MKFTEEQIRERSKRLWEDFGRPKGKDKEIWEYAEFLLKTYEGTYDEDGHFMDWHDGRCNAFAKKIRGE